MYSELFICHALILSSASQQSTITKLNQDFEEMPVSSLPLFGYNTVCSKRFLFSKSKKKKNNRKTFILDFFNSTSNVCVFVRAHMCMFICRCIFRLTKKKLTITIYIKPTFTSRENKNNHRALVQNANEK